MTEGSCQEKELAELRAACVLLRVTVAPLRPAHDLALPPPWESLTSHGDHRCPADSSVAVRVPMPQITASRGDKLLAEKTREGQSGAPGVLTHEELGVAGGGTSGGPRPRGAHRWRLHLSPPGRVACALLFRPPGRGGGDGPLGDPAISRGLPRIPPSFSLTLELRPPQWLKVPFAPSPGGGGGLRV